MKVFVIGPQGAGKTVFATMLNDYANQNTQGALKFRAADIATKKYLSKELEELRKGDWPRSNTEGKMVSLNWKWDINGQTSDICLTDPSGQDITKELCGESSALQIVNNIQGADLLILLVDLFGHQKGNKEKKIENGWIVEHVLMNLTDNQYLIFAVTKADMLTGSLPRHKWASRDAVLQLTQSMMADFNLMGYQARLNRPNCQVLAFSSVATTENRVQDGKLVRLPKSPLASEGIDMVVHAVLNVWKEKAERELIEAKKNVWATVKKTAGAFGLLVSVYLLYWLLRSL